MEIITQKGNAMFITKQKGEYYLVNLKTEKKIKADPADNPSIFLKLGYWGDAKPTAAQEKQIKEIMAGEGE